MLLSSASNNLALAKNASGADSLLYSSGAANPLAGQPLTIVLSSTGAAGITTEAFFDNISLTAIGEQNVTRILPQLAFGGGWYTALYFTNTTTAPVSFTVNFIGDDGNPLTIPAFGGSFVTVNLASRGTALIEAPNTGALQIGYVSVSLPAGVTGYGVFRQSIPGLNDQEAVVPLSAATATASTMVFDDTKYATGVAVVNLNSADTTVTATARDRQGNVLGSTLIPLPARGKKAIFLGQLMPSVTGNVGSVDFTVAVGSIATLGLRFNGAAFTSVPTSDR